MHGKVVGRVETKGHNDIHKINEKKNKILTHTEQIKLGSWLQKKNKKGKLRKWNNRAVE